jgi:hypothetical protein
MQYAETHTISGSERPIRRLSPGHGGRLGRRPPTGEIEHRQVEMNGETPPPMSRDQKRRDSGDPEVDPRNADRFDAFGETERASEGVQTEIVGRSRRQWAGLPESADRAIDHVRLTDVIELPAGRQLTLTHTVEIENQRKPPRVAEAVILLLSPTSGG